MAEQGTGGPTGIKLEISWGESPLVIQRDTSSGFGSAVEIARISDVIGLYTDSLSVDGVTYYYRARSEPTGKTVSAWCSTVSDKPHDL